MLKNLFILFCIACVPNLSTAQNKADLRKNAIQFLDYLSQNGGMWKAKNEDFNIQEEYGFPYFLLHFESVDSLSVRATISGIDTRKDTILFWELWEFYEPSKSKTLFVQRAPTGIFAVAEASFPSATRREGELDFQFPNGRTLRHKDTHNILSVDKMSSDSYDFNPELEEWENESHLIWIRQTDPLN